MDKHENSEENDDNEMKDIIERRADPYWRVKFNIWLSFAIFMYGSKMLGIGMSKLDEIWLFFFEHLSIMISGIIILIFFKTFYRYPFTINTPTLSFLTILAALFNSLGNIFVIFGIHYSLQSGTSPAVVNGLIMGNVIVIIVVGILFFGEKHGIKEGVGIIIALTGLVIVILQKESGSNKEENSLFWYAVLFASGGSMMWGIWAIIGKYIALHYTRSLIEYTLLSTILSGGFGGLAILYLLSRNVTMNPLNNDKTLFYIVSACGAGIFTSFGITCYLNALKYGGVGVATLLVNLQLIVEMIEEFIVFQILPSILGGIGMALTLIGASVIVLYQQPLWENS